MGGTKGEISQATIQCGRSNSSLELEPMYASKEEVNALKATIT